MVLPLVTNSWEAAQMIPLSRAKLSSGWRRVDPSTNALARNFGGFLPELWAATQPGESISFRFKAHFPFSKTA
jgi:hypothetical protein